MHAKEIFLKELATMGKQFDKQGPSADKVNSGMKGAKDPLKIKLENITL